MCNKKLFPKTKSNGEDVPENFPFIQGKKQTALAENQQLSELRDWLLPMLMNGQATVKDMEEENLAIAAEPEVGYGKKK